MNENQEPNLPPEEVTDRVPLDTTEIESQVISAEIEESAPALQGLRRFIVAARLAWTSETRITRQQSDHVITSTPSGARLVRGFKSAEEDPAVAPVKPVERLTSQHRQAQARKVRHAHLDQWRLNQVYGSQIKPETQQATTDQEGSHSVDKARWAQGRQKLEDKDRGSAHDLGSAANEQRLYGPIGERQRMRFYRRMHERSAVRQVARLERKVSRHNQRLDRGATGDTAPGIIRRGLIDRSLRKEQRLAERLDELRMQGGQIRTEREEEFYEQSTPSVDVGTVSETLEQPPKRSAPDPSRLDEMHIKNW
jgi:hypothetical protein